MYHSAGFPVAASKRSNDRLGMDGAVAPWAGLRYATAADSNKTCKRIGFLKTLETVLDRGEAAILDRVDIGRDGGVDAGLSLHEILHEARFAAREHAQRVVHHQ